MPLLAVELGGHNTDFREVNPLLGIMSPNFRISPGFPPDFPKSYSLISHHTFLLNMLFESFLSYITVYGLSITGYIPHSCIMG